MDDPPERGDPRREPIYRAILMVLVASVLVGAVLTLTGETLFGSRALSNAGLGMALLCGVLYWIFRLLGSRAARREGRREDRDD
mgnify:CR=1 FL=1